MIGWYLNFSRLFVENISFEQEKMKLWNKWHYVEDKTVIIQHVLKMHRFPFLLKHIKLISRMFFNLCHICKHKLFKGWLKNFHETWCEQYAIRGHSSYNFMFVISNAWWSLVWTSIVEALLAVFCSACKIFVWQTDFSKVWR